MTLLTIIKRSLRYYWRPNAAVVLGVAIAGSVLVGSLLVGDSVKGSLRAFALERLGRVEYVLAARPFFREALAADLRDDPDIARPFDLSVPAIVLNATAQHASSRVVIPRVTVLGVHDDFWRLGRSAAPGTLEGRRVVLNQSLAQDIGAEKGDAILLNVGRRGAAPLDTIFGRRSLRDTVRSMRVVVDGILPAQGIGQFSLRSDELRPRNVYISLSWLQRQLDREAQANTLLLGSMADRASRPAKAGVLEKALASSLRLEDYGLRLLPYTARGYLSLESSGFVLSQPVVDEARRAANEAGLRAGITSIYLANSLTLARESATGRAMPYSVVAGLDTGVGLPLGTLPMVDGRAAPSLDPDDILLNAWAADDIGAEIGDVVEMAYYVSTRRGEPVTRTREFVVRGIVAMEAPALDSALVPSFEGITDADTMQEWDPPFPVDLSRIRPSDEEYWKEYRTAPKAFVSLETARSFWLADDSLGEDWVTSVWMAPANVADLSKAAEALDHDLVRRLAPEKHGLRFRPVKEDALAAAKGSTDFGVLFLSMSMFLVAAAAGLVALLLRLTVERRASQAGILLATGFTPTSAARVLAGEGLILALIGVLIGAPLGVGYAWLIIHGLRTWWQGAVGPFAFSLHGNVLSLIIGSAAGLVISGAAIWWGGRDLRRTDTLRLLAGWQALTVRPRGTARRRARQVGVLALAVAALLLILSGRFGVLSTTGAFFGGGAALLTAILAFFCWQLQTKESRASRRLMSLQRLAWRGASRNWLRSLLTVGLVGCASFIIVAVAANRRDPSRLDTRRITSGAGGFNLMARCDLPIHVDLNTMEGRTQLGFVPENESALDGTGIVSLRMSGGDDISCLNIQRPSTPRVLGVPHQLTERGGFTFAEFVPEEDVPGESPWHLLEEAGPAAAPVAAEQSIVVPAFADAATARWILHAGLGDEIEVTGQRGQEVRLRLVGLLADSIFAGELLISDQQFVRHFDPDSGYRYFLIDTAPDRERGAASVLRKGLGELGFDVERTADALGRYARVQNTYLATFQTLGGLGLLLGTFGLVTVLLRGVVERRSEFAMMLALGFRRSRLVAMILAENGLLLLLGLIAGTVSALVAVAPHLVSTMADVRWPSLAAALAACLLSGLISCLVAAAASVRKELLSALRSE